MLLPNALLSKVRTIVVVLLLVYIVTACRMLRTDNGQPRLRHCLNDREPFESTILIGPLSTRRKLVRLSIFRLIVRVLPFVMVNIVNELDGSFVTLSVSSFNRRVAGLVQTIGTRTFLAPLCNVRGIIVLHVLSARVRCNRRILIGVDGTNNDFGCIELTLLVTDATAILVVNAGLKLKLHSSVSRFNATCSPTDLSIVSTPLFLASYICTSIKPSEQY